VISKYFNHLNKYIYYSVAGVFSALPPFLLIPILTQHLSKQDFAKTTLTWGVVVFLSSLIGLGSANSAATRVYKLQNNDFSNHLKSILYITVTSGLLIGAFGYLFNYHVDELYPVAPLAFILTVLIALFFALANLFGSLHISLDRPVSYLNMYVTYGSTTIISIHLLIKYTTVGINGFYLGLLLGSAAMAAISIRHNVSRILKGTLCVEHCKSAIIFGMPLMLHSLAMNMMSMSDRFIIAEKIGLTYVALYTVTAQVALLANFAAHAIIKGVQPKMFHLLRRYGPEMRYPVYRLVVIYSTTTFILSLVIGLLTPIIVSEISAPDFRLEWHVTLFISIGGLFGAWYMIFSLIIQFYERTLLLASITVSAALLHILMSSTLVSQYGIAGASFAYATSGALMFIVTAYVAINLLRNICVRSRS
jgi:O-antigen/teichoic acid export membrane protein